jgi:DNA-binding LacI/PurR family transcriptional regulator
VLNGTARVSGRTRAGVEEAMTRLAYVRQRARSTPGERVSSIAAVVCEDNIRLFTDSFFSRILLGASRELPPGEVQLALLVVRSPADYPSVERYVSRGHADGVLLISAHGRDPLAATLQALGVPVVLAGRPLYPSGLPYVDADNRAGAKEAVRHLLTSGRRVVATVAGPPDMAVGVDRLLGYQDSMKDADFGGSVVYGDFSQASGEHATTRLLDQRPDLDAVFAASDLMALGALRTLRRAGRRVPDDVAVVGFDDAPLAQQTDPRLTTVRQPVEEMGAAMVRHLLRRLGGASVTRHHTVLGTELVVRDSS